MPTYGDSLARGRAIRLIREETERFKRDVLAAQFNAPTRPGRWYKAVVKDIRRSLGRGIVLDHEAESGKRAKHVFVTLDILDHYMGFTTYYVSKKHMKVHMADQPIQLTLHLIQRLIQDGVDPTLEAMTKAVTPIFNMILTNIGKNGIPDKGSPINVMTEKGLAGCVVSMEGAVVVRTWLPITSMTDKQIAQYTGRLND